MPRNRDDDDDDLDDDEEEDDRPRRKKRSSSAGGVDAVIPFRNGMALMAYYFGVFGLIGCVLGGVGGVVGIAPIILGILGLMKASKDPEARGRVHAWVGIGLGAFEVLTACGAGGFVVYLIMSDPRRR
jgi:hypothetical protein